MALHREVDTKDLVEELRSAVSNVCEELLSANRLDSTMEASAALKSVLEVIASNPHVVGKEFQCWMVSADIQLGDVKKLDAQLRNVTMPNQRGRLHRTLLDRVRTILRREKDNYSAHRYFQVLYGYVAQMEKNFEELRHAVELKGETPPDSHELLDCAVRLESIAFGLRNLCGAQGAGMGGYGLPDSPGSGDASYDGGPDDGGFFDDGEFGHGYGSGGFHGGYGGPTGGAGGSGGFPMQMDFKKEADVESVLKKLAATSLGSSSGQSISYSSSATRALKVEEKVVSDKSLDKTQAESTKEKETAAATSPKACN